jgi:ribosomal protein S27AE
MRVQTELPAGVTVNEILGRPACPRCGEMMFAAVATQFLGRGLISNRWSCEACEHEFQTSLQLPMPECC